MRLYKGAAVFAVFIVWWRMTEMGNGWLSDLISILFGVLIFPFFAVLFDAVLVRERKNALQRGLYLALSLILGLSAVYVGATVMGSVAKLICREMGVGLPETVIAVILALVAAYISSQGEKTVRKFSRVAIVLSILSAAFVFVLALSRFSWGTGAADIMYSLWSLAEKTDAEGIKESFLSLIFSVVVATAWLSLSRQKENAGGESLGDTLKGLGLGAAVLLLCFFTVVLSEGMEFSALRQYPYLSSVGSMTVGKLFMRPDGVVYFSCLGVAFAALAVCVSLLCRFLDGGRQKRTPYAVGAMIFAVHILVR